MHLKLLSNDFVTNKIRGSEIIIEINNLLFGLVFFYVTGVQ